MLAVKINRWLSGRYAKVISRKEPKRWVGRDDPTERGLRPNSEQSNFELHFASIRRNDPIERGLNWS